MGVANSALPGRQIAIHIGVSHPLYGALIAYVGAFVPELHKRIIPRVNIIQDTDLLLRQCGGRSDLPVGATFPSTVHAAVREANFRSQMLTEPHISEVNAVSPEIGKK